MPVPVLLGVGVEANLAHRIEQLRPRDQYVKHQQHRCRSTAPPARPPAGEGKGQTHSVEVTRSRHRTLGGRPAKAPEQRQHRSIVGHHVIPLGCLQNHGNVAQTRVRHDPAKGRFTDHSYPDQLVSVLMRSERRLGVVQVDQPQLVTARNLYAQVVLNPHAESWYAQSLDDAIRDYDFTAVMAMPYMEKAADPDAFLSRLVDEVRQKPHGLDRVVFELQSTDWASRHDLSTEELARQLRLLYSLGARHTGYYPDNLHRGTPDPAILQPMFAAHSSEPVAS